MSGVRLKGRRASIEFVGEYADGPHVQRGIVVLPVDDLGADVVNSATEGLACARGMDCPSKI
jgi:hypothetical protein